MEQLTIQCNRDIIYSGGDFMPKNSEARIRANNKYNAKTYDELKFRVKKGERELLRSYLDSKHSSLNSFVTACMSYCIDNNVDITSCKPLGDVLPKGE